MSKRLKRFVAFALSIMLLPVIPITGANASYTTENDVYTWDLTNITDEIGYDETAFQNGTAYEYHGLTITGNASAAVINEKGIKLGRVVSNDGTMNIAYTPPCPGKLTVMAQIGVYSKKYYSKIYVNTKLGVTGDEGNPIITGTEEKEETGETTLEAGNTYYIYNGSNASAYIKSITFTPDLSQATASMTLNNTFSDNMLIQRDKPIILKGDCAFLTGAEITLTNENTKVVEQTKTIDLNGMFSWRTTLDEVSNYTDTYTLTITPKSTLDGAEAIEVKNILFGDLYLCAGQSNMVVAASNYKNIDYTSEQLGTSHNDIRYMDLSAKRKYSAAKQESVIDTAVWKSLNSGGVPAVAYSFAEKLNYETGVPVGFITSSYAGTYISQWLPNTGLDSLNKNNNLYNTEIYPFRDMQLSGILWYQGESDHRKTETYKERLKMLIPLYRELFANEEDVPFYYVQIARWNGSIDPEDPTASDPALMAEVRAIQSEVYSELKDTEDNFGIIPTLDLYGSKDNKTTTNNSKWGPSGARYSIHPGQKPVIAERAVNWVLKDIYNKTTHKDGTAIYTTGPVYKSKTSDGNTLTVEFETTGDLELMSAEQYSDNDSEAIRTEYGIDTSKPQEFEIAGDDNVYYRAEATLNGNKVILTSDKVSAPVNFRYGYTGRGGKVYVECPNLTDDTNLPALVTSTAYGTSGDTPVTENKQYIHISFDDTYVCLKNIIDNADTYTSIFDDETFSFLKKMHDKYGAVFTLNCFNKSKTATDYDISNLPSKFAKDFQDNDDWLKFAFHAEDDNAIYGSASSASSGKLATTEQAVTSYNKFRDAVMTATGNNAASIDCVTRLGFFSGSEENLLAFKELGVKGLFTADDVAKSRSSYYLTDEQKETVNTEGILYDTETGLLFLRSQPRFEVNQKTATDDTPLQTLFTEIESYKNVKVIELFTHEHRVTDKYTDGVIDYENGEYDTYYGTYTMQQLIEEYLKWAIDNGYGFDFPENQYAELLGITDDNPTDPDEPTDPAIESDLLPAGKVLQKADTASMTTFAPSSEVAADTYYLADDASHDGTIKYLKNGTSIYGQGNIFTHSASGNLLGSDTNSSVTFYDLVFDGAGKKSSSVPFNTDSKAGEWTFANCLVRNYNAEGNAFMSIGGANKSTVNLSNFKIDDTVTAAHSIDISATSKGTLNLGANVTIPDLHITEGATTAITFAADFSGAVGISADASFRNRDESNLQNPIATVASGADMSKVACLDENCTVKAVNGKLYIMTTEAEPEKDAVLYAVYTLDGTADGEITRTKLLTSYSGETVSVPKSALAARKFTDADGLYDVYECVSADKEQITLVKGDNIVYVTVKHADGKYYYWEDFETYEAGGIPTDNKWYHGGASTVSDFINCTTDNADTTLAARWYSSNTGSARNKSFSLFGGTPEVPKGEKLVFSADFRMSQTRNADYRTSLSFGNGTDTMMLMSVANSITMTVNDSDTVIPPSVSGTKDETGGDSTAFTKWLNVKITIDPVKTENNTTVTLTSLTDGDKFTVNGTEQTSYSYTTTSSVNAVTQMSVNLCKGYRGAVVADNIKLYNTQSEYLTPAKNELAQAIAIYGDIDKSIYEDNGISAYDTAVTNANNVLADSHATNKNAKDAKTALINAASSLRLKPGRNGERTVINENPDWIFIKEKNYQSEVSEITDSAPDELSLSGWTRVDVPHTWNAYDGSDGGGDYDTCKSWYRKSMYINSAYEGKKVYLEFDGASIRTELYINGVHVPFSYDNPFGTANSDGVEYEHKGGFNTFRFDITDYINYGESNTVAVSVDNRIKADTLPLSGDYSREGGIYRDVSLIVTNPVHIDMLDDGSAGLYLTPQKKTAVTDDENKDFTLTAAAKIVNDSDEDRTVKIEASLCEPDHFDIPDNEYIKEHLRFNPEDMYTEGGKTVGEFEAKTVTIKAGESYDYTDTIDVTRPKLWDGLESPYRYEVKLAVSEETEITENALEYKDNTVICHKDGTLIIASYDSGALDNVVTREVNAGDTISTEQKAGTKIMLWDSLNGMKPLSKAITFPVAEQQNEQDNLITESVTLESVTETVGFRYFRAPNPEGINKGGSFYLNGRQYPIEGVGKHQDWGKEDGALGIATTEKEMLSDVGTIYELGANGVRLVHYQHSLDEIELYDKLGITVWSEPALCSAMTNADADAYPAFEKATLYQLSAMIKQQYNKPCVLFWGFSNEITHEWDDNLKQIAAQEKKFTSAPALFLKMQNLAKSLDPVRLTTYAANTRRHEGDLYTDITGSNIYPYWYVNRTAASVAKNDYEALQRWITDGTTKPISVSEYGGAAIVGNTYEYNADGSVDFLGTSAESNTTYQAYLHEKVYKEFTTSANAYWGKYVWQMFDSASDGKTDGTMLGINTKGLVSYDHTTRKDAYYFYKANWNDFEPFAYVVNASRTQRPDPTTIIRAYTNMDLCQLYVNGVKYGEPITDTNENDKVSDGVHVFMWYDVPLTGGDDKIEVRGIKDGTENCSSLNTNGEITFKTMFDGTSIKSNDTSKLIINGSDAVMQCMAKDAPAVSEIADLVAILSTSNISVIMPDGTAVTSSKLSEGMKIRVTAADSTYKDYTVKVDDITNDAVITASEGDGSCLVDGDTAVSWDGGAGSSVTIDLGGEYNLNAVDMYSTGEISYTAQVSSDGTSYTAATVTGGKFAADTSGRYVRFTFTNAAEISEINIYGWRFDNIGNYRIDGKNIYLSTSSEHDTDELMTNLLLVGQATYDFVLEEATRVLSDGAILRVTEKYGDTVDYTIKISD